MSVKSKTIPKLLKMIGTDQDTNQDVYEELVKRSHDGTTRTRKSIAQKLPKLFTSKSLNVEHTAIFEIIEQLEFSTKFLAMLAILDFRTGKVPDTYKDRASSKLDEILDNFIVQADEQALDGINTLKSALGIPKAIKNKAQSAHIKLNDKLHPPIKREIKESIYIDTADELTIDKQWKMCRVSLERSTGASYTTISVTFENPKAMQTVTIKSSQQVEVDTLLEKINKAKFKQADTSTMREWVYYNFKR